MPEGITPQDSASVARFMREYRRLGPDGEAPVQEFARRLRWAVARTRHLAEWLDERDMIDTDRGLGTEVTVIEGR